MFIISFSHAKINCKKKKKLTRKSQERQKRLTFSQSRSQMTCTFVKNKKEPKNALVIFQKEEEDIVYFYCFFSFFLPRVSDRQ
jgi:hypothetical protein